MTENSPPSYSRNENPVTIHFSTEEFKRFVFETTQTPSEEVRRYDLGFDVTRDDVKRITDKLYYFIKRTNNLISYEFSATIYTSEKMKRKVNSSEDFFNIENHPSTFSEALSVTLSYFVIFQREDGLNVPEKQIINLRFFALKRGRIEVDIRTTEFTWPEAIFAHLKSEFDGLGDSISQSFPVSNNPILSIHKIFRESTTISVITAFTTVLFLAVAIFSIVGNPGQSGFIPADKITIYSSETRSFEIVKLEDILNSGDVAGFIDRVRDAEYLRKMHEPEDRLDKIFKDLKDTFIAIPGYFWCGFLAIMALAYLNLRERSRALQNLSGRIWLSNAKMPERGKPSVSSGILESGLVSFFVSLFFFFIAAVIGLGQS